MAWKAPDGHIYDEVDIGIVSKYYTEADHETTLTEDFGSATIFDLRFGMGAVLRAMDYKVFRHDYEALLDYYLDNLEILGFEVVDCGSESVRSAVSGAYSKGRAAAASGAARTRLAVSKARPKKPAPKSSSCKSKSTKPKTKGAKR